MVLGRFQCYHLCGNWLVGTICWCQSQQVMVVVIIIAARARMKSPECLVSEITIQLDNQLQHCQQVHHHCYKHLFILPQ